MGSPLNHRFYKGKGLYGFVVVQALFKTDNY